MLGACADCGLYRWKCALVSLQHRRASAGAGAEPPPPPLLLLLLIRGLLRWTVRSLLEWRERARWPPRLAEGVCG
jgi:hypothetical protein